MIIEDEEGYELDISRYFKRLIVSVIWLELFCTAMNCKKLVSSIL
jgi:hypothetical protein